MQCLSVSVKRLSVGVLVCGACSSGAVCAVVGVVLCVLWEVVSEKSL